MAKNITTPKYLLRQRAVLMRMTEDFGYNNADIAVIFNMDASSVSRILANVRANPDEFEITLGKKTKALIK